MSPSLILSQWYREDVRDFQIYGYWRSALRKYAPEVPILMIDNGGPIRPPYTDIEIVPAVEMLEHGRGTPGHWVNCWRSMAYGMELAVERGIENVLFIGQNLIVGTTFVEECLESLQSYPVLLNAGVLGLAYAVYAEYMAARPASVPALWTRRLPPTPAGILEVWLSRWCRELRIPTGPFPKLQHERDQPMRPTDTFCFHSTPREIREFCDGRGIPCAL